MRTLQQSADATTAAPQFLTTGAVLKETGPTVPVAFVSAAVASSVAAEALRRVAEAPAMRWAKRVKRHHGVPRPEVAP